MKLSVLLNCFPLLYIKEIAREIDNAVASLICLGNNGTPTWSSWLLAQRKESKFTRPASDTQHEDENTDHLTELVSYLLFTCIESKPTLSEASVTTVTQFFWKQGRERNNLRGIELLRPIDGLRSLLKFFPLLRCGNPGTHIRIMITVFHPLSSFLLCKSHIQ